MKLRGCLINLLFFGVLLFLFGVSSYFSFRFFVRGTSVMTPNLVGRSISNARALASDLGIVIEEDPEQERHSETVPPERVVWQSRSPGTAVKHGSTLLVARSLGPLVTEVPDLSGESPRAAMLEFSQRGFGFGSLSQMDLGGSRSVVTSSPPPGTVASGQTPVSLLVSSGESPRSYVMPDLIDRDVERVKRELESIGLEVDNVRFESYPGIPEGVIIRQLPTPGARLSERDVITLTVSRGDEDVVFETRPSLRLEEENR